MSSELEFLSPDLAEERAVFASPLARALEHAPNQLSGSEPQSPGIRDLSRTGKIEVRGEIGDLDLGEVVKITPRRALVLCDYEETAELRAQLRERFDTVVDVTGALAGLAVRGEALMRRLTDLDLDALPAVGMLAHVPATVLRDGDEFRIFVPQEYGHYVAEVVLDAMDGLR